MLGFQFYVVIGQKRWGFQIAPFHWHVGKRTWPQHAMIMLGPILLTAEDGVV